MQKKILIILALLMCLPVFAFAETIVLKSGKTVEGKLTEKTDKYIKIDFDGVPLTYFMDEIESIRQQGQSISETTSTIANPQPQGQLEAITIVSASPDFIKEWVGASYSHAPHIQRIKDANRNQTIYCAIIVSGYGIDKNGKIDLIGDYELVEPDGKITMQEKGMFKINTERGGSTNS